MNTLFKISRKFGVGAVVMLLAARAVFAGIPEPETVFYGKVINRTSGQEYLLTQGSLRWTITPSNGPSIEINGTLDALRNGEFSYRLNVPHQALVFGTDVTSNHLALPILKRLCSHVQITVDGQPAKIIAPGTSTFGVG